MTGDVTIYRVAELYPISAEARSTAITQNVLTWERNIDNKPVLSRALTGDERAYLLDRRSKLATAMAPGDTKEIRKSVSRMLAGFMAGKEVSDKSAVASIAQYISTLKRLPWWAIERACQKFSRGEITEVSGQPVNPAYGPSTAQLYQIASSLCTEFYKEMQAVNSAVTGVLEHKPSPEEVERVSAGFDELVGGMKSFVDAEQEGRAAERRARDPYRPPNDEQIRDSLQRVKEHMERQRA
jgi:hypothetical protein